MLQRHRWVWSSPDEDDLSRRPGGRRHGAGSTAVMVVAAKGGALGNRLWLAAHFIGTALENDLRLAYPAFDEYAGDFPVFADDVWCRFPERRGVIPAVPLARSATFFAARGAAAALARSPRRLPGAAVLRLPSNETCDMGSRQFLDLARRTKLLLLQGWLFRNESAVHRQAPALRRLLAPSPVVREAAARTFRQASLGAALTIGVHVRRGDYRTFLGGRYFYAVEAYAAWLRTLAAEVGDGNVAFLVTSDAPGECQRLRATAQRVTVAAGRPVEDLFALSFCDYIIGPPSTFSSAAAFVGDRPLLQPVTEAASPRLSDFRRISDDHTPPQ
jgi:hypothetical protein